MFPIISLFSNNCIHVSDAFWCILRKGKNTTALLYKKMCFEHSLLLRKRGMFGQAQKNKKLKKTGPVVEESPAFKTNLSVNTSSIKTYLH